MRNLLLIVLLLYITNLTLFGQNCSINAGLSTSICLNDSMKLYGTRSGLFSPNSKCKWSQVSGPKVYIENPDSLITYVSGYIPGIYSFKINNVCKDGIISEDNVDIEVLPLTIAKAGKDTLLCPGTSYTLEGNKPLTSNESGYWSVLSNGYGLTIHSLSNPNSTISLSAVLPGITTLRWTIKNSNGCYSYDDVNITNCGGVSPINAGIDKILDNCFTGSTCTKLVASSGGIGLGNQIGTWTQVSGPNEATIDQKNSHATSVCNLIEGVYIFRYTVTGPCVTGFDEVEITVPASNNSVPIVKANSLNKNTSICNGSSSIVLTGNDPDNYNDKVEWLQTSGPVLVQFETPNKPTTVVNGLTKFGTYTFKYKITNSISGCFATNEVIYVLFEPGTVDAGPDQLLPCNTREAIITPTITGFGKLSYSIIDGPIGAFTYPTSQQYTGDIKNLNVPGTYRIEVIYLFGPECPLVKDIVDITVSLPPTGANAGSFQNFACASTTTQLAGNNPVLTGTGTGKWSQISGPNKSVLVNPNNYICDVIGTIPGVYTFRWTISGGNKCTDNFDDIVVVSPDSIVTKANAGTDKIQCIHSSVILEGNSFRADEYVTWQVAPSDGVSFYPSNKIANPTVIGLKASTTYTFIYTITNSCDSVSIDTVKITTSSISGPSIASAGNNQCLPLNTKTIQLDAVIPTSGYGQWTQIIGPTCIITNPLLPNTTVTNITKGNYKFVWTVSVSGCNNSNSDTILITVSDNTTIANAGEDITKCGSQINLKANTSLNGIGRWSQISGDGNATIESITNPLTSINNLSTGLYSFRWTITNGACGSNYDDVIVSISSPPSVANAGMDQTICGNGTNIKLNATLPTEGIGQWVWISGNGNPTINDRNTPSATIPKLNFGEQTFRWIVTGGPACPQSFDDVKINVVSTANAGADINLCNASSTLLFGNTGSKGTWSQISGPQAKIIQIPIEHPVATVSNLLPDVTYTFRYSIAATLTCQSTFDDVIINNSSSLFANAGKDETYCDASSFSLKANKPAQGETGKWTVLSDQTGYSFFPNENDPNAVLSGVANGIYNLKWTVSNGICSSSDIIKIDNHIAPTKAYAGKNDTICLVNSIQLNANTPSNGIGKWTQISGPNDIVFDSPDNPKSSINGLTVGTYHLKWSISNNYCSASSDEIQITVLNNADIAFAGNNQSICASTFVLNANTPSGANKAIWKQISGPNAALFASSENPNCVVSNLLPGKYKFLWKIYNEKCYTTDTIEIIVNPTVQVYAGEDIISCNKNTEILLNNASVSGFTNIGTWSIITGEGKLSTTLPTSTPSYVIFYPSNNFNGIVTLRLTAKDNCIEVTDDRKINFYTPTNNVIALNDSLLISPNTSVNIDVLQNDISNNIEPLKLCSNSIIVQPAHGTAMVNSDGTVSYKPVPGYFGIDSFNYKLCNTNVNYETPNSPCATKGNDNAWVYLTIDGCIIPNSFSPDGDGVNDYFEIPCAKGNIQFTVFNRWGIELYKNDAYNNEWDGSYNGAPLPEGTYFFMLKYSSDNVNKLNKNGFITIRR